MKMKKTWRRILAAFTVSIILLNGITVSAATVPEQAEQPKWKDAFALMEYVGVNFYEQNPGVWLELEDVSPELPYYESGTLLGSVLREQAYAAYVEGEGAFSEENLDEDGEATLTGDAANCYNDFYAAGIALVDSLKAATGEKYIDDIIGTWDRFWMEQDEPLWEKVEKEQIITVTSPEEAPDTASMAPGTYWVLESDLEAYGNAVDYNGSQWKEWDDQNLWESHDGGPDILRSDLQNCISTVTSAYNTLLGKLHEGTKETQSPIEEKPLEPAPESVSEPAAAEEPPVPVTVNEVTFSNGVKSKSSLDGVYCNTYVSGVVYQDEKAKIQQAAGLAKEEIQAGAVIKYYICSSLDKGMNEKLSKDAAAQGYQLQGVIKNDLYKLNKGEINLIKTTSETLTVILGVPSRLKGEQYEFVVFTYDENGNFVTLKDIDTDNSTITVQADSFGYWAIGYRNRQ